jgi:hypothetical protein
MVSSYPGILARHNKRGGGKTKAKIVGHCTVSAALRLALRSTLGVCNSRPRRDEPDLPGHMTSTANFLNSWYVQVPSLVLAVLSYLLIARLALDLAFGARGDNVAFRALRWLTGPFVRAVGAITPRVVPGALVTACAVLWIFAARIALVQVAAAMAMWRMTG